MAGSHDGAPRGWRVISHEERVDDDCISNAGLNRHLQYLWGLRYIDDVIWHREDANGDQDFVDAGDERWWHRTDTQFSTVAILDDGANLQERVKYDAYGKALHHRWRDVDGDRDYDSADRTIIINIAFGLTNQIGQASYRAEADLDRDGDIDSADLSIADTNYESALAPGVLSDSTVKNTIGWDGYVFNPETTQNGGGLYTVRFRWYFSDLGAWTRRDPLLYDAGSMNLYQYVDSQPVRYVDPLGLEPPTYDPADDWEIIYPPSKIAPWMLQPGQQHEKLGTAMRRQMNVARGRGARAQNVPDVLNFWFGYWLQTSGEGASALQNAIWKKLLTCLQEGGYPVVMHNPQRQSRWQRDPIPGKDPITGEDSELGWTEYVRAGLGVGAYEIHCYKSPCDAMDRLAEYLDRNRERYYEGLERRRHQANPLYDPSLEEFLHWYRNYAGQYSIYEEYCGEYCKKLREEQRQLRQEYLREQERQRRLLEERRLRNQRRGWTWRDVLRALTQPFEGPLPIIN